MSRRADLIVAETLAARLPPLVLAAQRLAVNVAAGRHGRRRAGAGEQFWQYRDARSGDSYRAIDWRRSARGENLYIREREWESVATMVIEIDDRPTMDWRSARSLPTKHARAELLALALACLALEGGERVAVSGRTPALSGSAALGRIAAGLGTPPVLAVPTRGKLALFGDFLDPPASIGASLTALGAAGRGGVLVQILDPAEQDFPYRGRVKFEPVSGSGNGEDIARSEAVAPIYRDRIAAQIDAVVRLAERSALIPLLHRTDSAAAPALAAIYATLDAARHRAS